MRASGGDDVRSRMRMGWVVLAVTVVACSTSHGECHKDTDCKGLRVCQKGSCTEPGHNERAVRLMNELADHVCACKPGDDACLEAAKKLMDDTLDDLKNEKGSDEDKRDIEAA